MALTTFSRKLYSPSQHWVYTDLEILGKGVRGSVYKADYKRQIVVIKEIRQKDLHGKNEEAALKYLRKLMLTHRLPPYYVFLYGNYVEGNFRYLVLEYFPVNLTKYWLITHAVSDYFLILYQIADAVDFLERIQFNHGDLWSDNVMLVFRDGPHVKLIDFDSSYGKCCSHPSLGGSDHTRRKFYLGYDLNRLFDQLLSEYRHYQVDYDNMYVHFPSKIYQLLRSLHPTHPNKALWDNPELSGENVKDFLRG